MFDFIYTQGFHDFCLNNCPNSVYEYFKQSGWWDHLFPKAYCESFAADLAQQACELVQENPVATGLFGLTLLSSSVASAVWAYKNKLAKDRAELESIEKQKEALEITRVESPPPVLPLVQHNEPVHASSSSWQQSVPSSSAVTVDMPVDAPKKISVQTLLIKVFNYFKENPHEHHSVLAARFGVDERNIRDFLSLPGCRHPSSNIFSTHVINGPQKGDALELLGLPRDGSYPKDSLQRDHFHNLCDLIGMPSHREDQGVRVNTVGGEGSKFKHY